MTAVETSTRIALKNILCAVDFSSVSDLLLEYAAGLAQTYDSSLLLAHVVPSLAATMAPLQRSARDWADLRQSAELDLRRAAERHRLTGSNVRVQVTDGNAAEALLQAAREQPADLLVLGTHGRHGMGRLALGSVAEKVFRRASCPVWTVGPKTRAHRSLFPLRRLLFASDFSAESCAALPFALSLAQEYQAKLVLAHFVHPDIRAPRERARIRQIYAPMLCALVPDDAARWCELEAVVEFDHVAQGIVAVAGQTLADLIVLGIRGAGGLGAVEDHLPAAVAYTVVTDAACPVLTVRKNPAAPQRA